MLRGIYAAASSMVQETIKQDTIANNIANASTPGFKRDTATFESFRSLMLSASTEPQSRLGTVSFGSITQGTHVDMTQGAIRDTGNPLDLALPKDCYLVVETKAGHAYTREGSLVIGDGKCLSTAKGHPVMGAGGYGVGGRIIADGSPVQIDVDGTVSIRGAVVGRLQVVRFKEPVAFQRDENGYSLAQGQTPESVSMPEIMPGSLESSNVNPVREMVSLITVLRSYEASAKSLQAQDETLSKAVNEIAR